LSGEGPDSFEIAAFWGRKKMGNQIFLIISVSLSLGMAGCTNLRVLLAGEDVITVPGRTVEVKARLQQRNIPFFKDIEEVPLHFRLTSAPPGVDVKLEEQKITDEKGGASVFLPVEKEGIYKIEVLYSGSKKFESKVDEIVVLAIEHQKPMAVFDLDYTLTKNNWLHDVEKIKPYDENTVRVIQEMSEKYAIIYLSGRPQPVHRATKKWLKMNGFPDGPILLWYPSKLEWLTTDLYKKDALMTLREEGFNLALGVGDRAKDARLYRKVKMKTIMLTKNKKKNGNGAASPELVEVLNWLELGSVVMGTK
jgi:hypothetical protein